MTEVPIKPGVSLSLPRQVRKFVERKEEIKFSSAITVELIGSAGGDWLIVDAARVSTKHSEGVGPRDIEPGSKDAGLIYALVRQRHGAPFSHGSLTFYVECPIFIAREWRTHKIVMYQTTDDMGYSEASARYKPLKPLFWEPSSDRKMMLPEPQEYKPMKPCFLAPVPDEYIEVTAELRDAYSYAWQSYTDLLSFGVAPEVARAVLPVGIFTSMYVTGNFRSFTHFCSLRVHDEQATFVSYPQAEIEEAAKAIEKVLSVGWPVSYQAWLDNGRISL